ncbi:hypothetical protein ACQ3I4_11570 [Zafaria sp. Z1313]|uniref:hypothetical protein n=1 Tax=Zafaria sp. Z1313 TaxID=3423202 RepID=UPI003D30278B
MTLKTDFFAAIPGYDDLTAAHARLEAKALELNQYKRPATVNASDLIDLAAAAQPLPTGIALRNKQIIEEARAHDLDRQLYRTAQKGVKARQADCIRSHGDDGLRVLRRRLKEIVAEVREHTAVLGGLRDEAQVYKTRNDSKIDAWEALVKLAADYLDVRELQFMVHAAQAGSEALVELRTVAQLRDSFEVTSHWRDERHRVRLGTGSNAPGEVEAFAAWLVSYDVSPALQLHRTFLPTGTGAVAALIDQCTVGTPWVPSTETAQKLLGAASYVTKQRLSTVDLADREECRDRIYKLTRVLAKPYKNLASQPSRTKTVHRRISLPTP